MKSFPSFVVFSDGESCALRHTGGGKYYRDAGAWSVKAQWKNGKLLCSDRKGKLAHLFGKELVSCSGRKWRYDNGIWVPKELQSASRL